MVCRGLPCVTVVAIAFLSSLGRGVVEESGEARFQKKLLGECVNTTYAMQPPAARALSPLINAGEVETLASFSAGDPLRYFSVFDVASLPHRRKKMHHDDDDVWLTAKTCEFPSCRAQSVTLAFFGCDAALREDNGEPCTAKPVAVHSDRSLDHNLGLLALDNAMVGVGGYLSRHWSRRDARVWVLGALRDRTKLIARGLHKIEALDGMDRSSRSGCIERREWYRSRCNFDGRFSLARLRDSTLLYARANLHPRGGGRHVSVATVELRLPANSETISRRTSPTDVVRFAPPSENSRFAPARDNLFARVLADREAAAARANIYFAAVNANPVDNETLLGLFPTLVRNETDHERGAILIAATLDGRTFSSPAPLVSAFGVKGEINDHPVDGIVRRGDRVYVYVHAGVPGTLRHICDVGKALVEPTNPDAVGNVSRMYQGYFDLAPASELVRYAIDARRLVEFTAVAKVQLRGLAKDPNATEEAFVDTQQRGRLSEARSSSRFGGKKRRRPRSPTTTTTPIPPPIRVPPKRPPPTRTSVAEGAVPLVVNREAEAWSERHFGTETISNFEALFDSGETTTS